MNRSAATVFGGIALLVVAVIVLTLVAVKPWAGGDKGGSKAVDPPKLTLVSGVIGSEKSEFFADPAVQRRFAQNGLKVEVTTAGSRQIATTVDLSGLDFAFPSSSAAAQKLETKVGRTTSYSPFYSPMALATWKPILDLLSRIHVAKQDPSGVWTVDVAAYLKVVKAGTRWRDIAGNTTYPSTRSILIGSTDVTTSNSAAMYMDIAAYVLNGGSVVSSSAEERTVLPELAELFVKQGFTASSSAEPFADYLNQGMGARPLVMVYEAQFVQALIDASSGGGATMPQGAALAYLSPTVFSKHVVVPLTSAGDKVGKLLATDPALQRLAAEHGFRTNTDQFAAMVQRHHLHGLQDAILDIADTPSYDTNERLIAAISARAAARATTP